MTDPAFYHPDDPDYDAGLEDRLREIEDRADDAWRTANVAMGALVVTLLLLVFGVL